MGRMRQPHLILLLLTVVSFSFFIWQHRERYLRPYDYDYFGKLYSESQYVKGKLSEGGIGDDGLYAFAGYYYITGGDISQVSFESPPLAKYLVGLSVVFFGNELAINLIYVAVLLLTVYFIGSKLVQGKAIAAAATFFVTLDPLVTSHFAMSMLDLPMTILFLGGVYWYIKAAKSADPKKKFFWSAVFFSLSFTTRFSPILPLLLAVLASGLFTKGRKYWLPFVVFNIVLMPLIYILAHSAYFYYHPSLLEFLRYQFWIIKWRLGEPFVPGNIILTLFTGRYYSWWMDGGWLSASDWSILTPIFVILGLLGIWRWRKTFPNRVISMLVVAFLLYVAIGTVGVAKFVLPVYPLLIIAAVQTIHLWLRQFIQSYG